MTRNEGNVDRIVRAVLGIVLVALWIVGVTQGVLAIILGVVGAVLIVTAVVGFCPLYAVFGLNTCPVKGSAR